MKKIAWVYCLVIIFFLPVFVQSQGRISQCQYYENGKKAIVNQRCFDDVHRISDYSQYNKIKGRIESLSLEFGDRLMERSFEQVVFFSEPKIPEIFRPNYCVVFKYDPEKEDVVCLIFEVVCFDKHAIVSIPDKFYSQTDYGDKSFMDVIIEKIGGLS